MRLLALVCMLFFVGCSANPQKQKMEERSDSDLLETYDPLETYNRVAFSLNTRLDLWVIKPVSKGYNAVTPSFLKKGVTNFFDNLGEVKNTINALLQGKYQSAANSSGRLLANTTVGLLGFIDVASQMDLENCEDFHFGDTLASWGVSQGPYMVLPLFGPSTLRDGLALPMDFVMHPVTYVESQTAENSLWGLDVVSTRNNYLALEKDYPVYDYEFRREIHGRRLKYINEKCR